MNVRRSRVIPGNLPADVTSFVGRRRELSEARRLLGGSRLLTLTGVGGVGKTRLALHLAQATRRAYPDGVYFVDLAPLRDAELLTSAAAAALGVDNRSSRPPLESLAGFLAGKRLLLVLDNCEHLLEPCARLAAGLLRDAAEIHLLATSRQPLCIHGESVLEVPTLSLPDDAAGNGADAGTSDAVRLFEERAVQVVPDFSCGPDQRRAVGQLCRRLDGIPLAIELAAVRLRVLSVQQILDRLDDRFALLNAGNRAAQPRQQTLRAAINWSHDLCSSAERTLWGNLSVFPGSFDLDAAEDVCDVGGITRDDVVHVLAGLVDKSIVHREGDDRQVRFRLLDTIREYGRSLLSEAGREPEMRRKHRDHYQRMTEEAGQAWFSPKRQERLARFRRELPNIRAALDYCLDHDGEQQAALAIANATWDYWVVHGTLTEGRQWMDLVLRYEPVPSPARVQTLRLAARLAMLQGDSATARNLIRECVTHAGQIGDDTGARAHAAEIAGMTAHLAGHYGRAVELLEEATEGYRTAGEPLIIAMLGLAWANCMLGKLDRALELGEQLREIDAKYGPADSYRFLSLWVLGLVRYRQGDLPAAAALLRESIRLQTSIGEVFNTLRALEVLAWVTAAQGRHRDAALLLGSADSLWQRVDMRPSTVAPFRDLHDACVSGLRAVLGDQTYAAAFRDGAALDLDQTVAYALEGGRAAGGPPKGGGSGDASGLTRREREIAELVAQGLTNKEIAATLVIAQRTAEGHVEHILSKLGFTSRAQIASWATTRLPPQSPRPARP